MGISFICPLFISAWKNIERRHSFLHLLPERTKIKQGRKKNKIKSNTDIVLYFHFFVVLILIVPFCRDTTPPSHMSSNTKKVAFQHLQKCDAQAAGHGGGEKSRMFHVYHTVSHDNMHKGGLLHDGTVRMMTHKKINTLKWSVVLLVILFLSPYFLPFKQKTETQVSFFNILFIQETNKGKILTHFLNVRSIDQTEHSQKTIKH